MLLDTMIAELQGELAVLPDYMSGAFLNGLLDGVAIAAKAADDYSIVCTLHDATDKCLGHTARRATFSADSSMSDYTAGLDLAYGYAREIAGESIYDDDAPSHNLHAGDMELPDGSVLSIEIRGDSTIVERLVTEDGNAYRLHLTAGREARMKALSRFTLELWQFAKLFAA